MKIKNLISALCVSAAVMVSSVSVYAKDVDMETDVYQPDEICGYINLKPSTDADVYLKVYRHTPETVEEGYLVYDTVVYADTVHVSNNYVYGLEYNDLNIDKGTYEGYYDIFVGVHRHIGSREEEDIAYNKLTLTVEDVNFTGYETFCNINVTVVDEELEEPLCVQSGEKPNKTYDMTFSCVEEPEFTVGDANHDGKLNVRDAAFIASTLAQGKSEELPANSDINADGKVNVRDAAFIASYLAGAATLPDPTEPSTDSTEPTEVTDSTEVTEVTETTNPVESTEATEITDSTEVAVNTEVTDPTEMTDVTEISYMIPNPELSI